MLNWSLINFPFDLLYNENISNHNLLTRGQGLPPSINYRLQQRFLWTLSTQTVEWRCRYSWGPFTARDRTGGV